MNSLNAIKAIGQRVSLTMRRSTFLAYYIKETDFRQLAQYQTWVKSNYSQNRLVQTLDMLQAVYRYNVSFVDYYNFEFFRKSKTDKETYAGTGYMYEYQLRMNPRQERARLENKILFLENASQWVHRKWARGNDLEALGQVVAASGPMIVIKNSTDQAGRGVRVMQNTLAPSQLSELMNEEGFDLAEEYVVQHPKISALAPGSLNTLRIITEVDGEEVRILGARLRLGAGADIDNFSQGGIACCVDVESGQIVSDGFAMDFRKPAYQQHPVSGQLIKGFTIPNWTFILQQVRNIAVHFATCRSVGWDIAVTSENIELIEGNHNWSRNSWQIPAQRGLRVLIANPNKVDLNEPK